MPSDREQGYLMPLSLREWLPDDDLAWFIVDAVEKMDLSAFIGDYRADGHGRAAHDPRMMVALLLYANSLGVRSSRQIERQCRRDVGFRVVAANGAPDHTTIARFRVRHEAALKELFTESLRLCRAAGMIKLGVVALDGTKMGCPAALAANRTAEAIDKELEKIAATMLEEAAAVDAAEDALFGPEGRGDELPEGLRRREDRRARLAEAKARLDAEAAARAAAHQDHLAERAAQERATGKKLRGRKPKPPDPAAEAKANISDPESRIMKTQAGYLQGYNAQIVVTEEQVVIAAEVTDEANDVHQLHPMLAAVTTSLAAVGISDGVQVVVADAGYWSEDNLQQAVPTGPELLIATTKDWKTRKAMREAGIPTEPLPETASAQERMERELLSARGRELYAKRGQTVEPVFGQHKDGRGIRRFQRRGKAAAASEWKVINATHNLLKLYRRRQRVAMAPLVRAAATVAA